MHKRVTILILIAFITVGLYFLVGPDRSGPEEEAGSSQQFQSDTTDTLQDKRPGYSEQIDLSPGTAKLEMEILQIDKEAGEKFRITVRAQKVMGYGSSTPPIGEGAEFTINGDTYYKNAPEKVEGYSKGDIMIAIINRVQRPAIGDTSDLSKWSLVKVINE